MTVKMDGSKTKNYINSYLLIIIMFMVLVLYFMYFVLFVL